MDYMNKYHQWLDSDGMDEDTKKELRDIKDNAKEIEERFYRNLEFGTGGLRGIIGAGTNRMNRYTVGIATQGFANYIKTLGEEMKAKGVAIAYDSRNWSQEFAEEAALVLNGNGIKTYLFEEVKTTPELSFAVRYLGCAGGIVITASHNPPQYNGYKVYSPEGVQLVPHLAERVIEEVNKIDDFSKIRTMKREEAIIRGLFNLLDHRVEDAYIEAVKSQSLRGDSIQGVASDFKIVYTPLHGTGNKPVQRILKEVGFERVYVVEEQAQPNGNFPTVKYPNPEEETAFALALKVAKEKDAHILIATDPDSDRMGAIYRNKEGKYIRLNGNQIGALLTYYILKARKERGNLPEKGVVVKTIVTSELGGDIAKSFGLDVLNTLTGFKFIGEAIEEMIKKENKEFLFGYEESFGYLAGTHVREKDGVVASMLMAEMAAYYYGMDKTLGEVLEEIYGKYGYFHEDLRSITLEGKAGMEKIQNILSYFRENCPMDWNGKKVAYVEDYFTHRKYDGEKNVVQSLELPKSNVLKFILEDGSWFCIRPSGTEPKVKIYFSTKGASMEEAKNTAHGLMDGVMEKIKTLG